MALQRELMSTAVAVLAVLHAYGYVVLPTASIVTICMMQGLAQLSSVMRRPAKKTAAPSVLEQVCEHMNTFINSSVGSTLLWGGAGLFATVAFGKANQALGCSPFQVIGLACLCGGITQLAATLAAISSQEAEECGLEDVVTGARCPYNAAFWPDPEQESLQEQQQEHAQEQDESFMARLTAEYFRVTEDMDVTIEEASEFLLSLDGFDDEAQ